MSSFWKSSMIRHLLSFIVLIVLVIFIHVPVFDIGNTVITDHVYIWGFDGLSTWDKHASILEKFGFLAYVAAVIIQIILIIIRSENGRFSLLLVLSNLMILLCIFSTVLSSNILSEPEKVVPSTGVLLTIVLTMFRFFEYIGYIKTRSRTYLEVSA